MQAHAITVQESLYFLDEVRELMAHVPRPTGQAGVLSEPELRLMRAAIANGETPLAFVGRVLDARESEEAFLRQRTAWASASNARWVCS